MPAAAPRSTVPQSARTLVVALSATLFFLCLFLPALEFHGLNGAYVNGHPELQNTPGFDQTLDLWSGTHALFNGFFGILTGDFAGYANPCLWIAWAMLLADRIRSAAWWALAAALLSLLTFRLFQSPIPEDEGVVKQALLTHMHAGIWLWFASILLTLLACLLWWRQALPAPTFPNPYLPTKLPPPPPKPPSRQSL